MCLMQDTGSLYVLCKTDRQAIYIQRNNGTRLMCCFCCGKAIIITYYDCVSVALGMQNS
jgi:hypothetical protein